ncbi:rCG30334 [Rattus norvegicus]|uniref:RCG30334 n=1 Tax=Rattus norvegicus TaxID=10116 RepID=A6IMX0_RAT|nr:rCG30334 [Rattus norvegicus]
MSTDTKGRSTWSPTFRQPKPSQKSVPRRNKLDHSAIIRFLLTTKSAVKKTEDNTLVLTVDVKARSNRPRRNSMTLIRPDREEADS